ncbi:DUF5004 domain-containing protein [Mucilaginibacter hurinus]|nr:DUF5004 domain-containing protein [Mucilaginibacter hurinus]
MSIHIKNIKIQFFCIAILSVMAACKTNKSELIEPQKDISGTWQIAKIVQNGIDITPYADYSAFSITFNKDNTYSLSGELPFIVNSGGTWNFNDPQYPFSMLFRPTDGNAISSKLAFPIVGSKYQLGISFIKGCPGNYQNTYQYTFKLADK